MINGASKANSQALISEEKPRKDIESHFMKSKAKSLTADFAEGRRFENKDNLFGINQAE